MSNADGFKVLAPKELIVPLREGTDKPLTKGSLIISGAKLWFHNGSAYELVTSA